MSKLSKSQVDRLGERLRRGSRSDADIELLDEHRRAFQPGYAVVFEQTSRLLGLKPSGRAAKTTQSIVDKLRREHVRLSQIQDIAGCRLIVPNTIEQDRAGAALQDAFPTARVVDRRAAPSHGYRAVHVIATVDGFAVEVQIRTEVQDLWAQISEKLSDEVDWNIKYGSGPGKIIAMLNRLSDIMHDLDRDVSLTERMRISVAEASVKVAQLATEISHVRAEGSRLPSSIVTNADAMITGVNRFEIAKAAAEQLERNVSQLRGRCRARGDEAIKLIESLIGEVNHLRGAR